MALSTIVGRILVLGFFGLAATGCVANSYVISQDSYTVTHRNYAYAVYNNQHRLMTHPLDDLLKQIQLQWEARQPITDIYFISHGWNYAGSEAVANYHSYMELIDQFMTNKPPGFQPYFILITWTSTTRPTEDIANAILPFQFDEAIRPMTWWWTVSRYIF